MESLAQQTKSRDQVVRALLSLITISPFLYRPPGAYPCGRATLRAAPLPRVRCRPFMVSCVRLLCLVPERAKPRLLARHGMSYALALAPSAEAGRGFLSTVFGVPCVAHLRFVEPFCLARRRRRRRRGDAPRNTHSCSRRSTCRRPYGKTSWLHVVST